MTHYHSEDENDLAGTPHPESHVLKAKALEAAIIAGNAECREYAIPEPHDGIYEVAIRAYLSASQEAAAPSEEPVAWRVRERPGFDWGLVRTDPDRDPHFHCWEKQPLFASPALAPVAVSVKGLDWEKLEPGSINGHNKRLIVERAITPFGAYFIEQSFDEDSWWLTDGLMGADLAGPCRDKEAKAAAQSDFNARILSSILVAK